MQQLLAEIYNLKLIVVNPATPYQRVSVCTAPQAPLLVMPSYVVAIALLHAYYGRRGCCTVHGQCDHMKSSK